jgi:hypothetical protein
MTEREERRSIVRRTGDWDIDKSCFKSLLGFFSFLLFSSLALAETTVTATVDRNQLGLGESFTLQVTISTEGSVSSTPPSLPTISNVQMLHNWVSSQSRSSMVTTGQGVDFKTIRSKIYNYQFVTQAEGLVQIDPISVEAGGKTYMTQAIKIQVLKPGALAQAQPQQPAQQPRRPRDPFEQMEEQFNQLLNRHFGGAPGTGGFMTEPRNAKEAFFILAEVDKTEAYKGEQILVSWYLYTRGRVRDIDTLKYPTLKGFWKEDIQISTQLNFEQDVINGIPYDRALLASYALFPISEGKQEIDPYKAKATIVGGFGFGRGFQATKSSDKVPVLIKPLPQEGKPDNFTGAVGQFEMMVDAPNKSIVTHQPFPLKVRFEGRGNAKLIELPELPIGSNLEIYDIKNESQFFKNGQSFKEFEVLLIPREPGTLRIGSLKSSYFDTQKGEYVSLTSQPIELTVLPGAKQQSIGEERLKSSQEKKVLPDVVAEWNPSYRAAGHKYYIWPFLFALALIVLIGKGIMDSGVLNKNPSLEEKIKLRSGRIDRLYGKSQIRKVGIEATNMVYLVLGELSGEGGASEELDKMLAKTAPSVRREIEAPLKKLMEYFGVLGFGPRSYVDDFKDKKGLKEKLTELNKLLMKASQLSKGKMEDAE